MVAMVSYRQKKVLKMMIENDVDTMRMLIMIMKMMVIYDHDDL